VPGLAFLAGTSRDVLLMVGDEDIADINVPPTLGGLMFMFIGRHVVA